MLASRRLLLGLVSLLAACSSIDGMYRPACVAFEGETIQLNDGRFVWQRFTDERRIDQNGELIDPFPDFPKEGTYTLQSSVLQFSTNDGSDAYSYYLVQLGSDYYLLKQAENGAYLANGVLPDCALKLSANTA